MPVNKHGSNTRDSIMRIDELYQSRPMHSYFSCRFSIKKAKRKSRRFRMEKSFIAKVKKYNKPIYPVHISGQNSKRFYRTASIRKKWVLKSI